MFVKNFGSLNLHQFNNLSKFSNVSHYVSGRFGHNLEDAFNLSIKVGEENVAFKNRLRLAEALGVKSDDMIFPHQTHTTNVRIIRAGEREELDDVDALITSIPGICINVMSADCVPILLLDTKKNVIAAIHAGWRGTVGRIVTKTFEKMQENFSSRPGDIIASIGPSICAEVYEVGAEVVAAVKLALPNSFDKVLEFRNDKCHFDLWKANFLQLVEIGLQPSSIEISQLCTYKENHRFFSARKEGLSTGRFAAGIVLHKPV